MTEEETRDSNDPIRARAWSEFRAAGLLWFANRILHVFGWAIVIVLRQDGSSEAFPARTTFRGFEPRLEEQGFRMVTRYMQDAAPELAAEVEFVEPSDTPPGETP